MSANQSETVVGPNAETTLTPPVVKASPVLPGQSLHRVRRKAASSVLPSIKFNKQLKSLVGKSETQPELVKNLTSLLQSTGCQAVWMASCPSGNNQRPSSLLGDDQGLFQTVEPSVLSAISLAENNRGLISVTPANLDGYHLFAAPVYAPGGISDILIGLYPSTNPGKLPFDWAFDATIKEISSWAMGQFVQTSNQKLSSLSSFVNMAAAMNRTDNQLDAGITLVNELKNATDAEHVALILKSGKSGPFQLAAMSGVEFFDRNAATTQTVESTILGMDEEKPAFWSRAVSGKQDTNDAAAHSSNLKNFCDLFQTYGCALLPMRNSDSDLFGWLLISMNQEKIENPQTKKHFWQIASLVAGQLETVLKSQRTITRLARDNARAWFKQGIVKKIGAAFGLFAVAMCLPFSYQVPCDCQLQLTSRRFVSAPYEGVLENTLVESGDVVRRGQLLAKMDARQLRIQLSGLEADLASERKKRDSALARGNVAESQIARAEMQRLQSEIKVTQDRLASTQVVSPIEGVIVSGDLTKAQGARMEMGQTLFEVGPLEQMLVEIHIPEREIQHVKAEMPVSFEFDAFPFEIFSGTIQRIHPRAELLENESVFVAEVQLDNANGQLRPGLKGRARIRGQRHCLGWNLFHNAVEDARQWLIW